MADAEAATRVPSSPRPSIPARGERLGDAYVIEERLGSGGMGTVLRARALATDEPVAIKLMLEHAGADPELAARFRREARAMRALRNDHVARLLDLGQLDDATPYLVMELLEGRSLAREAAARAPLPIAEAVDYVLQACEGVAAAHAEGVVHRDLKPSNLFLTRTAEGAPLVKVLDFGLAKLVQGTSDASRATPLTETGALLGSPEYMAPEQMRSARHADERSDVWALGLVLFKLLTGEHAFEGESPPDRLIAAATEQPKQLGAVRPDAPAALGQVIARCLKKDPQLRFQDVDELARALAPYGDEHAGTRVERICEALRRGRAARDRNGALGPDDPPTVDDPALGRVVDEPTDTVTVPLGRLSEPAIAPPHAGRHLRAGLLGLAMAFALGLVAWWWLEPPAPPVPAVEAATDAGATRLQQPSASGAGEQASAARAPQAVGSASASSTQAGPPEQRAPAARGKSPRGATTGSGQAPANDLEGPLESTL